MQLALVRWGDVNNPLGQYLLLCLALLAIPAHAQAQPERYEAGRRLGAFERAWEGCADPALKKAALAKIKPASMSFLFGQLADAGRALDEGRQALALGKESPESIWAQSLQVVFQTHLADAADADISFRVQLFYSTGGKPFKDAKLIVRPAFPRGETGKAVVDGLDQLPLTAKLLLAGLGQGDHYMAVQIRAGERALATNYVQLSLVRDLKARLARLRKAVDGFGKKNLSIDQLSVRHICELLEDLAAGQILETDYPASRLLLEAEAAIEALRSGQAYYGGEKTGQFWLRLPDGKNPISVRLLAPDAVKEKQPMPLVIMLHGLGGSENMAFDAYGVGKSVKLCQERGWLFVAPRHWTVTHSLADLIDDVARLYPVDRTKVFVIGHSIGSLQALSAAQPRPGAAATRLAGIAAVGGGGTVRPKSDLRGVAFFVGVGTSDIALIGARSLHNQLKKTTVRALEYHEYEGVEHLVIVREALPDAFAFFDRIAKMP
jgi:pimeloyl-ACP methyl ester carboxylesterase